MDKLNVEVNLPEVTRVPRKDQQYYEKFGLYTLVSLTATLVLYLSYLGISNYTGTPGHKSYSLPIVDTIVGSDSASNGRSVCVTVRYHGKKCRAWFNLDDIQIIRDMHFPSTLQFESCDVEDDELPPNMSFRGKSVRMILPNGNYLGAWAGVFQKISDGYAEVERKKAELETGFRVELK